MLITHPGKKPIASTCCFSEEVIGFSYRLGGRQWAVTLVSQRDVTARAPHFVLHLTGLWYLIKVFRRVPLRLENEDGGSLLAWRSTLRHAIALLLVSACVLAGAPARAASTRFEFREIFPTGSAGSLTITGSFMGEFENGRISKLSDIHLFRDGVAFRGNGALYTFQFDAKRRSWREGGYLSLDGSANNIMFIDTNYGGGDASFYNYFYSVTGLGNAAFQPSFYRYRVPETTRLTVWRQPAAAGVPEPSAWALLVIGFGALGAAMRVRRSGRVRPA